MNGSSDYEDGWNDAAEGVERMDANYPEMAKKIITIEEYMKDFDPEWPEIVRQMVIDAFEAGNISGWHEGYNECREDERELLVHRLDVAGY